MGAAPTRDVRGAELAKERLVLRGKFRREGTRKSGNAATGCFKSLPHFMIAMLTIAANTAILDTLNSIPRKPS